jgi:hypothetical protein
MEGKMGLEDPKGAAGLGVAASAMDYAASAVTAASKNMRAMAGECFEISKKSFQQATQAWERLRTAHGLDDILAIQTDFMREAFESGAQHARKFGELMAAFPVEITKNCQDAWLKAFSAGVEAMQDAGKTASGTAATHTEGMRKSAAA